MYSPISKILTDYKNGKIEHWDAHDKILRTLLKPKRDEIWFIKHRIRTARMVLDNHSKLWIWQPKQKPVAHWKKPKNVEVSIAMVG